MKYEYMKSIRFLQMLRRTVFANILSSLIYLFSIDATCNSVNALDCVSIKKLCT